jgi:hypothetical protein
MFRAEMSGADLSFTDHRLRIFCLLSAAGPDRAHHHRQLEKYVMTDFTETRSMLKKLAMAHGAKTDIGRACHNLLEMTENYAKSRDADQQIRLKANINREMARLNGLVSQLH